MKTIARVLMSDRPHMKEKIGKETKIYSINDMDDRFDFVNVEFDDEGWEFGNGFVRFVGYEA